MEEVIVTIVRDLPSTAVLILFVSFVSKQFQQTTKLLADHLENLNKLIAKCIESKDLDEKERKIERNIAKLETMMTHFSSGRMTRKSTFDPGLRAKLDN